MGTKQKKLEWERKDQLHRTSSVTGGEQAEITITGNSEDIKAVDQALTLGTQWIRKDENGFLQYYPAYEVPPLQVDELVAPHFQPDTLARVDKGNGIEHGSSFYVQHPGGFHGKSGEVVRKLEAVGFEALRSRRGEDGRVWAIWYLPGAWAAKGSLKGADEKKIIDFIRRLCVGQFCLSGRSWAATLE